MWPFKNTINPTNKTRLTDYVNIELADNLEDLYKLLEDWESMRYDLVPGLIAKIVLLENKKKKEQ